MKYSNLYKLFLLIGIVLYTSCKPKPTPQEIKFIEVTSAQGTKEQIIPSNITQTEATLTSTVEYEGSERITQHGHVYSSEVQGDALIYNPSQSQSAKRNVFYTELGTKDTGGAFASSLTNLLPNTTYYTRAYIVVNNQVYYSSQNQFTTYDSATIRIIDINESTTYATITANISYVGTDDENNPNQIQQHGFVWTLSGEGNPTITTATDKTEYGQALSGEFMKTISGLNPNTSYQIRAYAITENITSYSFNTPFRTLPTAATIAAPTVGIEEYTIDKQNRRATLRGNIEYLGTSPIIEHGFVYSTTPNPNIKRENDIIINLGTTNLTLEFDSTIPISPATIYYVKAFAKNEHGTGHSTEQQIQFDEQYIPIPDPNFFNGLSADAIQYASHAISGQSILIEALQSLTRIIITEANITNTSGIEKMANLNRINLSDNLLTSIDVSSNPSLTFLILSRNSSLTELLLKNNPSLEYLQIQNASLTELDLSTNKSLNHLDVDNNDLEMLDISNNSSLTTLLSIRGNTLLTCVETAEGQTITTFYRDSGQSISTDCYQEDIESISIDISGSTYVGTITGTTITFNGIPNETTQITISEIALSAYATADTETGNSINISDFTKIEVEARDGVIKTYSIVINYLNNPFVEIPDDNFRNAIIANSAVNNSDVSGTSIRQDALERITSLQITDIERIVGGALNIVSLSGVEYMTSLTSIYLDDFYLQYIDVSNNTLLTNLYVLNTFLTSSIDVSNNTLLTNLSLSNNQLASIDVSMNRSLTNLSLSNNRLASINVSTNTELLGLSVGSNGLTDVNVSMNTLLAHLNVDRNSLTYVNVSKNTELLSLSVGNNSLTVLSISNNPLLVSLGSDSNSFTYLDISNNPSLAWISLWDNSLTDLDVSYNESLTWINLWGNDDLTCIQTASGQTIETVLSISGQYFSTDCSDD